LSDSYITFLRPVLFLLPLLRVLVIILAHPSNPEESPYFKVSFLPNSIAYSQILSIQMWVTLGPFFYHIMNPCVLVLSVPTALTEQQPAVSLTHMGLHKSSSLTLGKCRRKFTAVLLRKSFPPIFLSIRFLYT
jgi:hypothetical protein